MKAFQDKRSILWLAGLAILTFGLLAAFVVLPNTQAVSKTAADEIQVPRMENVPAEGAPKLKLDVDGK